MIISPWWLLTNQSNQIKSCPPPPQTSTLSCRPIAISQWVYPAIRISFDVGVLALLTRCSFFIGHFYEHCEMDDSTRLGLNCHCWWRLSLLVTVLACHCWWRVYTVSLYNFYTTKHKHLYDKFDCTIFALRWRHVTGTTHPTTVHMNRLNDLAFRPLSRVLLISKAKWHHSKHNKIYKSYKSKQNSCIKNKTKLFTLADLNRF